jgi:hypothetical protein
MSTALTVYLPPGDTYRGTARLRAAMAAEV